MSDVYFKASLQNTLNPEVGTFDNVDNKEGIFTLEDGEYYLTNNTSTSYRVYYPTEDMYSVGFTIEFDLNYKYTSNFGWCLLFYSDNSTYWHGFGIDGNNLEFRGSALPGSNDALHFQIVTSPSTWLHVKCTYDYDPNQNINFVRIYIDNVEVKSFPIGNNYGIKYIDILGNSVGFVSDAKIKNIIIYDNKKHYLDTTGLTLLWSKIKSLFATKTELASKANTSDLSTVATSGDYNDLINKPNISQLNPQIVFESWPDGPEAHNAMWGGRDITTAFNNGTFSTNVANGTFKDIFPGDYITKSVTISDTTYTVNWVVADCDYWINKGDDATTDHHVVIVPQTPIFNARMNPTSTTEGGYVGSWMYGETILQDCTTGIVNAFGSDHILEFRDYLTGDWFSQRCNLMSEAMVYNGPHCASSALDNTMATRQMSAFRLSEKAINYNRQWWWLRDVVSSKLFASVGDFGGSFLVEPDKAHLAYLGVRPFALLR